MDFDIGLMRQSGPWGKLWEGVDFIWLSPAGPFQEPTKHWFEVPNRFRGLDDGDKIHQKWDTGRFGFAAAQQRITISVPRLKDAEHDEYPLPEKYAKYSREYTANFSSAPYATNEGVSYPATYLRVDVRSPNGVEGYIDLGLGSPDKGLPEEGFCYTAQTGRGDLHLY